MDLLFGGRNDTADLNLRGSAEFEEHGSSDESEESGSINESALIGITCGIGIFAINSLTLAAIVHYDYVKETYLLDQKPLCS